MMDTTPGGETPMGITPSGETPGAYTDHLSLNSYRARVVDQESQRGRNMTSRNKFKAVSRERSVGKKEQLQSQHSVLKQIMSQKSETTNEARLPPLSVKNTKKQQPNLLEFTFDAEDNKN